MAHVEKYTAGAMGHMLAHYDRTKASSTSFIDESRTHLNYNLAESDQPLSQLDFIHKRLSEIKVLKRADVNVFCDWIVTAPQTISPDEYDLFFRETYKFLNERYGKENVIFAYVHMDETQPHIHYAFVPVTMDKKKNIPKLSAKEVITRKELKCFHTDLSKYMQNIFGRDIGILNGATDGGALTISELRRHSKNALAVDDTILKSKADELEKNRGKKVFKSDTVTMTGEEFEQTRRTLQEAATVLSNADSVNAAAKEKSEQAESFYRKAREKVAAAEKQAADIIHNAESKSDALISDAHKTMQEWESQRTEQEKELEQRKAELDALSVAVFNREAAAAEVAKQNDAAAEKNRQDAEYTKGWWHTCKKREQQLDEREKALDQRVDSPHEYYNIKLRQLFDKLSARDKDISLLRETIYDREDALKQAAVEVKCKNAEIDRLNGIIDRSEKDHAEALRRKDSEMATNIKAACEETEKAVTSRFEALLADANSKIAALTEKLTQAFRFIRNICLSIAKLGYVNDEYCADLTDRQYQLLDGILNFGSKVSREAGFDKNARDIDKAAVITDDIRAEMDKIPVAEEKSRNDDFCL